MKILTLCLLTAVLTLLFPSHVMGQTPAQVQRAFTPLVTPALPPRPRTPEQRICDESSRRLSQYPGARFEVLTDLVVQRFNPENAYHREAAYRWLAQELVRTNDRTVPAGLLDGGVGARLMAYVRSEYTVSEIERLACSDFAHLCQLNFAWMATFERGAWCAAVETVRPSPEHRGFIPGTLDAHLCVTNGFLPGPLNCYSDPRPLTVQARLTGSRTATPTVIASSSILPAFPYSEEEMTGMGGAAWGSGYSPSDRTMLRNRTPLPTVRPARPAATP